MTTLVNPPSLVWSIWRHRPGADYVMSCCLSKSFTEYTQIVAANSMKTAVHICTMPFSLYIWLSIFYPSDLVKGGSGRRAVCLHRYVVFSWTICSQVFGFFSTFSLVSPLSLMPKPPALELKPAWSCKQEVSPKLYCTQNIPEVRRLCWRRGRKELRLDCRQRSCEKNEAKEKKKEGGREKNERNGCRETER